MVIVEKSFPRGGVSISKEKSSTQNETQIFGAVQKKIKKLKTKSSKKHLNDDSNQNQSLEIFSAEPLNYETIQDGMVIMGIVKRVDQLFLNIALPGRIVARVSALEISESYTKAMKAFLQNTSQSEGYKSLKELYSEGQIIYGRVQEVKGGKKGNVQIDMTLKPSEVHADLGHSNIRKGFVFNGAIEEVQEHGYIIESGIKGLRCFAPLDKCQAGHVVGEMLFLKVEKITSDTTASTCICKEVKPNKLKVKDQSEPKLDYLLPCSIVNFQVSKHLKDGLKGSIMNETFSACVNEHQLGNSLTMMEDYEINSQYEARILYVMPLTKLVYLTLNLRNNVQKTEDDEGDNLEDKLKRGDIVEKAKVHHLGTGGIILILNKRFKAILSYKTIKANYKGNYDQDELLTKYGKGSKHKVRILDYDIMDSLYICTDDISTVNEKFFALEDLKPGEQVTATVKAHDHKVGGYALQLGKVKAIIEKLFLSPSAIILDENTKVKCRIVAVNQERRIAYLTNRPEYMAKNCNFLTSVEDAKLNNNYMGTVVKSNKNFALVKFFNDTKGILYYHTSISEHLEEGQTMQFRVAEKKDGQLILGLVENVFKMGEICPVSVVNKLESGLEIKVSYGSEDDTDKNMEFKGLIPIHFLSDHIDLLRAKLQMLQPGSEMQAVCVSGSIFSLRDVQYFLQHVTPSWKSVKPGDVLKAYVKDVNDEVVDIILPINGFAKSVKVHLNMMLMDNNNSEQVFVMKDQVIYVKILSKVELTKTITISAKLTDVWDCQLSSTASFIESYLNEVNSIKKTLKKNGNPLGRCMIGDKVSATFKCVNSTTNDWEYVLEKLDVTGIVKSWSVGKSPPPKVDSKQECVILWVDYSNNLVFISNKPGDIEHISTEKNIPDNLRGKGNMNAKVLFKNESVFVCSLKKGKNPLVYCPVQLHFNDFEKTASFKLCEGQFCKLTFVHETMPIAVLDDTHKIWTEFNRKRKLHTQLEVKGKKMKMEEIKDSKGNEIKLNKEDKEKPQKERKRKTSEAIPMANKKTKLKEHKEETIEEDSGDTVLFYEDKTADKKAAAKVIKIENATTVNEAPKSTKSPNVSLSGIGNFWSTDLSHISKKDESSDEESSDGDAAAGDKKSKKKLTAAEKFKQQREEEARLRAIEEKYADPTQLPDSVDQFDRLVLSDPNNSKHWINYMVFHLQSTEIDKARAVARRALKTITFRNADDQINIWVALLNLELRYGTKETFNDILKEALMYNEPLKIYLRAVEIISDAQKTQDLIEIIGIITKKFKTEQEMWRVAANAFFSIDMVERAQQMLHKALACLPERDHVNTIVMFANLNHKHGHNEMAQTLLDQVVTSYPKRVDVWCQYVDMLVKEDLIESARNILERAVVQTIPLRKMRTIFKKYLEFEERFGSEANVQRVKQLAVDYVNKNENL